MPHLLLISADSELHREVQESLADTPWTISWHVDAPAPDSQTPRDLVLLDVRHPLASTQWESDVPVVTVAPRHSALAGAPEADSDESLVKALGFYESLIDASVDPIVAADLNGQIILFNPSAEQLSGRHVEDVVGKLDLGTLLGDTSTKTLLSQLTSDMHGGRGRLELNSTVLVHAAGDRIPVRLSASLIYEHAEPAAVVLIFTDLREKLRVEQRLAEAKKKLAFSEKQGVLAELAGTAAHELNQPLTSMLAYAELLRRKSEPGSHAAEVAEVMIREAERMAEIVRKIGRITHYETTSYVGEQRIFDLDRASDVSQAEEP